VIYSVKGKLIHTEQELAVVECGGVGYACRTTYATLSQIGKTGSELC
jgi:Holliday junction DNA helicase RuvA